MLCYGGILLKERFGYDDALDVVGVHGVGGATGALLTGVFASKLVNAAGNNGLSHGNPGAARARSSSASSRRSRSRSS